ncbi:hypothetical protein COT78_03085 [Candidatus Berkelbacteria bacterium CG10_big_fil_rev_8_21_14_0_10_43_13]|uniref:Uncharacterized protein n=1 Tax=Candidatus Berkelbacteria bacterium CG10_big_fil_rev_8_21_14_0_10_43_13 TaxID=1974514 RepID=A0A2H0W616_9BACT|nr:MAG: hypothetical protein COT78_03085 [Candidatus Berkelbacteria bacterium CG10_big_fil_rev_8_21_14_0_10_43_13]
MRTEHQLQFAPQRYLNSIVDQTKRAGYQFVALVTVSTDDVAHYVPAMAAQSSNLFFRVPERAVLVQAELHEYIEDFSRADHEPVDQNDFGYRHAWRLTLYWECGEVGYQRWLDHWEDEHPNASFAEMSTDVTVMVPDGFHYVGSWGGDHYDEDASCFFRPGRRTGPETIVEAIQVLTSVPQLAADDVFKELLVTGFAPSDIFPGCEPVFTSRFPWRRLRQFARHIHGLPFKPSTC